MQKAKTPFSEVGLSKGMRMKWVIKRGQDLWGGAISLVSLLCLVGAAVAIHERGEGGEEPSQIITPRGGGTPLIDNKLVVETFYQAFSTNDVEKVQGLLAVNYGVQDSTVIFDSHYSKYEVFSKNIAVRMRALHAALPEFSLAVMELLAEGNKVLARIQIQGVQRGSFLGIEPTNKPIVIKEFALFTIEGGKITHLNEVWNELGVMRQVGYIAL